MMMFHSVQASTENDFENFCNFRKKYQGHNKNFIMIDIPNYIAMTTS